MNNEVIVDMLQTSSRKESPSIQEEEKVKTSDENIAHREEKTTAKVAIRETIDGFLDDFRRQKIRSIDGSTEVENPLKQVVKTRHTLMISLGTGIGTGLLVSTGPILSLAGPLGIIIGYAVSSIMIVFVMQAAGELAITYSNLVGNFIAYPSFIVDPAFGFSIAIIYTLQWCLVLPLQLVTASITLTFWKTLDNVNLDYFILIFLLLIVAVNLFGGVKGYVEMEFICNICKVLLLLGFTILGLILVTGSAGDTNGYIGGRYWKDPGPLANGFKGIATVFCFAAFSYGGIEMIVMTAAEQKNPIKSIPSASKKVMYRVILIYLLPLVIIGLLVPYNNPNLLQIHGADDLENEQFGSNASPFVISVELYGIRVVPHFINSIILISVLSVANSAFYSAPRLLLSMSSQNILPKKINYVDVKGRPLICMAIVFIFGLIGFVAASDKRDEIFIWLLAISGLSQIFLWMSISISHIRFRKAMSVQGYSLDFLTYKAKTGVIGSWIALVLSMFILVCQFWVAISPISATSSNGLDVEVFFQNYLAFPIILILYFGYKAYHHQWSILIPAKDIDLTSKTDIFDTELESEHYGDGSKLNNQSKNDLSKVSNSSQQPFNIETTERKDNVKVFKKIYNFWC